MYIKLLTRCVQKVGKKPLRDSGTIHLRLSPNFKEFDTINVAAYSSDICFQCRGGWDSYLNVG